MDDTEFLERIETHRDEFYRYIHRNVWNASVAEDVFSSAIIAAYKQLGKFQDGTNFRAWIYKILTNKCFVANRETKRLAIDIDTIDENQFADTRQERLKALEDPHWFLEQCGDEIHQALKRLSTAERSCLLLLTHRRYSYKEISEILEIPIGTVMTHLSRGRRKLKKALIDHAIKEGIVPPNSQSQTNIVNIGRETG